MSAQGLERNLPFSDAAANLNEGVSNAIKYFEQSYNEFRSVLDLTRFHANEDLLNDLWRSQIQRSKHLSIVNVARGRGQRPESAAADPQGHSSPNENAAASRSQITTGPFSHLIFHEVQRTLLDHLHQFVHSEIPRRLPCENREYGDDATSEAEKERAAQVLKGKVEVVFRGLCRDVRGMGQDYRLASSAIRELRAIEMYMQDFKHGWISRYQMNEDWGNGEGSNGRAAEY